MKHTFFLLSSASAFGRIAPVLVRLVLSFLLLASVLPAGARKARRLGRYGIAPGGYSGIAPLGGDRYAVVSDRDTQAGFHVWHISIDPHTGRLLDVSDEGFLCQPGRQERDAEGVAYCPARQSVLVSGEADNAILEHRLDGTLTGCRLDVPSQVTGALAGNRGFESLTYDSVGHHFWIMNESPLLYESHSLRLLLMQFDDRLRLSASYHYYMENPHSVKSVRDYYHGVSAMAAMPDGTLMVLEREAHIARHYQGSRCWCTLFRFTPLTGEKQLVGRWNSRFGVFNTRFANYEGLCLGPRLQDGRLTLLMLTDSQCGYGRGPWRLRDRLRVVVLNP